MKRIIALKPLLDEDVPVWRPVEVMQMEHDWFRVVGGQPEVERWMFPPESNVRCVLRSFQEDPTLRLIIVEAIGVQAPDGDVSAKASDA